MKVERVVFDGSKVKANACKHRAMRYGWMQEDEKRLKEEVKRLSQQAERVDTEEDARYGRDRTGDEWPAELARREPRLQKIQQAQRALEERAREQAQGEGQSVEKHAPRTFHPWETSEHTRCAPHQGVFTGALSPDIALSIPKPRTNFKRPCEVLLV